MDMLNFFGPTTNLVLLLRASYVLVAFSIIALYAVPSVRARLFSYGPRSVQVIRRKAGKANLKDTSTSTPPSADGNHPVLDAVAAIRVPRSWFSHYYVYAFSASWFWAYQVWTRGPVYQRIAQHVHLGEDEAMSAEQAVLLWLLFTFQVFRRLCESLVLSKPTTSTLWIGHWIMGLGFYVATGVAVWIEAIPSIERHPITIETLRKVPNLLSLNLIPFGLYVFATYSQNKAHRHLASLPAGPNYTIPTDRLFARTLTPHYVAEYFIYLAMAVIAAPQWYFSNLTLSCAAFFVAVNLAVTAGETRNWYVKQFGEEAIRGRYRMMPGLW